MSVLSGGILTDRKLLQREKCREDDKDFTSEYPSTVLPSATSKVNVQQCDVLGDGNRMQFHYRKARSKNWEHGIYDCVESTEQK